MTWGGKRPSWSAFDACGWCGVDAREACRDDDNEIAEAPCSTRQRLAVTREERKAEKTARPPAPLRESTKAKATRLLADLARAPVTRLALRQRLRVRAFMILERCGCARVDNDVVVITAKGEDVLAGRAHAPFVRRDVFSMPEPP